MGGIRPPKWSSKAAEDAERALRRKWPFIGWATLPFDYGDSLGVIARFGEERSQEQVRYARRYHGPNDFNKLAKWAHVTFSSNAADDLEGNKDVVGLFLAKWVDSDEKRTWLGLPS
jgi:hypothetical protein